LIKWRQLGEKTDKGYYLSVDPAPPLSKELTIEELKNDLNNTNLSLFQRYRAMFALRDKNNDEAAIALLTGFSDNSALFRHEVAYVLGQMQREVTIEGLQKILSDKKEHSMVRHEAAEALGAIGGNIVQQILEEFKNDEEVVVLQSCEVALDTMDYWSNNI
jgi:deoxyhypusine monooxygenase